MYILGNYRVRRLDSSNIVCEEFKSGGRVIDRGAAVGKISRDRWVMVGGYYFSWQAAFYYILDKVSFEHYTEINQVLEKLLEVEEHLKCM